MSKLKKLINLIVIFVILIENLIFVIPSLSFAVENEENESETYSEPVASTGFSGGDGTEANPWEIHNVSDLLFFANKVNTGTSYAGQYIKLINDIDLSVIENWKPIGVTSSMTAGTKVFSGNFDGSGKAIKNCTIKIDSTQKNGIYFQNAKKCNCT